MHFVIGGAFNGKAEWVRNTYDLHEGLSVQWIRGFETDICKIKHLEHSSSLVVLEGIEYGIKQLSSQHDSDQVRKSWRQILQGWKSWEQSEHGRKVVLIGSDLTKGVVPMSKVDRKWRDDVGRCYQETVMWCEKVDYIWYGLAESLKKEEQK